MTDTPKKPPTVDLKAFARAGDWGVQRSMYLPKGPVTIASIRRDRATPCRVEVEEAA